MHLDELRDRVDDPELVAVLDRIDDGFPTEIDKMNPIEVAADVMDGIVEHRRIRTLTGRHTRWSSIEDVYETFRPWRDQPAPDIEDKALDLVRRLMVIAECVIEPSPVHRPREVHSIHIVCDDCALRGEHHNGWVEVPTNMSRASWETGVQSMLAARGLDCTRYHADTHRVRRRRSETSDFEVVMLCPLTSGR